MVHVGLQPEPGGAGSRAPELVGGGGQPALRLLLLARAAEPLVARAAHSAAAQPVHAAAQPPVDARVLGHARKGGSAAED
eukprot:790980-Pleurochrysis_carterae.AAC.1